MSGDLAGTAMGQQGGAEQASGQQGTGQPDAAQHDDGQQGAAEQGTAGHQGAAEQAAGREGAVSATTRQILEDLSRAGWEVPWAESPTSGAGPQERAELELAFATAIRRTGSLMQLMG